MIVYVVLDEKNEEGSVGCIGCMGNVVNFGSVYGNGKGQNQNKVNT